MQLFFCILFLEMPKGMSSFFACYHRFNFVFLFLLFLLLPLSFFCIFKHRDSTATTARGVLISMCSCLANQAGIIATSITTSRGKLFLLSFLLFPFDFFCLFIFGPVTNGYKASAHLVGLIVGDNSDCWQLISSPSLPILSSLFYITTLPILLDCDTWQRYFRQHYWARLL